MQTTLGRGGSTSSPAGRLDGAVKEKTMLDKPVRELHYRLAL